MYIQRIGNNSGRRFDGAAAPSCSITLDTDSAAGLGLQPAEITGQSFGVTSSSAGTGYLASTDADAPTALWGSGRRWIEIHTYSLSGTDTSASIRAGFARLDTFVSFVLRARSNVSDPLRDVLLLDNTGTPIATVSIAAGTGDVALGIDSSGNCFYDIGAGPVRPGGSFDAAFSGASIALLGIASFTNAAESASMGIRTNGADFTLPKFVSGDADWCGNELTLWTPDSLVTEGATIFFADPTDSDVTYQDTSLTTISDDTGEVIGGVRNQSTIDSTSTLTQPTTASKMLKAADGRIQRDAADTSQRLLFGMTLDISAGATFAIQAKGDTTAHENFGGDTVHLRASVGTTTLTTRCGSTTQTNFASAVNSAGENTIIMTAQGGNYTVYSNGTSRGTQAAGVTTTSFDEIVIGTSSPTTTSSGQARYGRIAAIGDAITSDEAVTLNAWLAKV